jgi:hypothetical protein
VGHVTLPGAEEHLDHVGDALVDVVLDEVEPVAHGQQLAQGDGAPRVVGGRPLRDAGRAGEVDEAVPDEQSDDGVQHRLGHRPAEQPGLARHRLGGPVEVLEPAPVALGHDPAAMDHDDGVGGGEWPVVVAHLIQQRVERDTHPRRGRVSRP